MYDLIIIGGGPAGITAGIYAARQKLNTLLITKNFGGQIARKVIGIENYPGFEQISGLDLIGKLEKHLRKQDIDIKMSEVTKVEKKDNSFLVWINSNKEKIESRAVIVATGADPRPLKVPGEKEFIGKGVSYCAVCDGPVFADKEVVIIGGGNSGFESALFLMDWVKKIYILEFNPEVKADKENQDLVKKNKKVKIITNAALKEIKGDKFVQSVIYENRTTKEEKTLSVDGVFVETGSQPATSFINGLVGFNKRGEIEVAFETYQTKTPGLFAAGDVNTGRFKQIVISCGEGAKTALAAFDYLRKQVKA